MNSNSKFYWSTGQIELHYNYVMYCGVSSTIPFLQKTILRPRKGRTVTESHLHGSLHYTALWWQSMGLVPYPLLMYRWSKQTESSLNPFFLSLLRLCLGSGPPAVPINSMADFQYHHQLSLIFTWQNQPVSPLVKKNWVFSTRLSYFSKENKLEEGFGCPSSTSELCYLGKPVSASAQQKFLWGLNWALSFLRLSAPGWKTWAEALLSGYPTKQLQPGWLLTVISQSPSSRGVWFGLLCF